MLLLSKTGVKRNVLNNTTKKGYKTSADVLRIFQRKLSGWKHQQSIPATMASFLQRIMASLPRVAHLPPMRTGLSTGARATLVVLCVLDLVLGSHAASHYVRPHHLHERWHLPHHATKEALHCGTHLYYEIPQYGVCYKAWSYVPGEHSPETWEEDYPLCGGKRQSPINIQHEKAEHDGNLTEFEFNGFDVPPAQMVMKNNGHSSQLDLIFEKGIMSVSGGGLPGVYVPAQIHWHWGAIDNRGGEHTLEGDLFPIEMHVVCWNQKFSNLHTAADKVPDGLAVLGFWFEITEEDNENLNPIIENLQLIRLVSNTHIANITPTFKVADLFPDDLRGYYRYMGSLTTPACYESVVWTIFHQKIPISERQLYEFRQLKMGESEHSLWMEDNFRPVQLLNDRVVYTSIRL